VALLLAFALALAGGFVVGAIAAVAGVDIESDPPGLTIGLTLVQDLAFVGAALLLANMTGRLSARDLGLRATRFFAGVGWSALAYVAMLVVGAALVYAFGVQDEQPDDVLEELGVDEGGLLLVLGALVVCVGAPIAEEILFRGYMYTALRNRFGIGLAGAITGVIFGAVHVFNFSGKPWELAVASVLTLTFFGFVLCLLYQRTGSLYPCIGLHALNNAVAFGTQQDWTWEIAVLFASASALCVVILAPLHRRRPAPRTA
jgi:hypothetical protein